MYLPYQSATCPLPAVSHPVCPPSIALVFGSSLVIIHWTTAVVLLCVLTAASDLEPSQSRQIFFDISFPSNPAKICCPVSTRLQLALACFALLCRAVLCPAATRRANAGQWVGATVRLDDVVLPRASPVCHRCYTGLTLPPHPLSPLPSQPSRDAFLTPSRRHG